MRTVLIAVVCLILGGVAGAFVVSRALIEPFDVLAWPYVNRPVVTTSPLAASAGSVQLSIPTGTPLIYQHSATGQQHFAVLLVGVPDVAYPVGDADNLVKLYLSGESQ